jgi:hypothetical protein
LDKDYHYNMPIICADQQYCQPSGASGVIVGSGSAAWGSWTTLLDPVVSDLFMTGINVWTDTAHYGHCVQIAIGAAGAEVTVAEIWLELGSAGPSYASCGFVPFVFPLDAFPTGVRISARCYNTWIGGNIYLGFNYLLKPLSVLSTIKTTTSTIQCVSGASISFPASSWEWSSRTQLIASAVAGTVVTYFSTTQSDATSPCELQFEEGAAGFESEVRNLGELHVNNAAYGGPRIYVPPVPLLVTVGARLSIRGRRASSSAVTEHINVGYQTGVSL